MAVAHRVAVADGDDGDRRQHGAAVLGQPDVLPAPPRLAGRAKVGVEQRRAARLERAADLFDRDLTAAASERSSRRPRQPALVVDGETAGLGRAAAQAAGHRRAATGARGAHEGPLGVHLGSTRQKHAPMVGYDRVPHIGRTERFWRLRPYAVPAGALVREVRP
jgi:hypothetical protein